MATFLVTVEYQEPTYRQDGHCYAFTFRVDATSPASAVDVALAEFRTMAVLSSVGWVREVVAVHVKPVQPLDGRDSDHVPADCQARSLS